jgi:hypothetical protein
MKLGYLAGVLGLVLTIASAATADPPQQNACAQAQAALDAAGKSLAKATQDARDASDALQPKLQQLNAMFAKWNSDCANAQGPQTAACAQLAGAIAALQPVVATLQAQFNVAQATQTAAQNAMAQAQSAKAKACSG